MSKTASNDVVALLNRAFGEIGVAGKYAFDALCQYEFTSAVVWLIIQVLWIVGTIWAGYKLIKYGMSDDGDDELVELLIYPVGIAAAVSVVLLGYVPSTVAAIASPAGAVVKSILENLK